MRRSTVLASATLVALAAAACSQPAESGGGDGEDPRASSLTIVTGGTSGVYYPIGGALRQVIGQSLEGTTASVEATGASVENIRLIGNGSADLAITQGDAADQAYNAMSDFEGTEVRTNTIAVLYPNVFHTVTLASVKNRLGLDCFGDVQGHRYSVGDLGSGNESTTNQVFDSLGLDVASDIDRRQLGYAETANALSSGALDAGSWVVGQGHGGISELAATDDVALVPMCEDEVESITGGYGGYTEHVIPAGTYPGVEEDVTTIAVWNALVVPETFNEDQAYELTKAIFENSDAVVGVYAPAQEYLVPENAANAPVPLHPGAVRYYEEVGVEVPDELKG